MFREENVRMDTDANLILYINASNGGIQIKMLKTYR
jgi:hypothetical protein